MVRLETATFLHNGNPVYPRQGHDPDRTHRFHLYTMSTGQIHPLAPSPAVVCHPQAVPDPGLYYSVQVSGDHIAILLNSVNAGENELIVWEWKSGIIEAVSSCITCLTPSATKKKTDHHRRRDTRLFFPV